MVVILAPGRLARRRQPLRRLRLLFNLCLKLNKFITLADKKFANADSSLLSSILADAPTTTQFRR